MRLVLNNCLEGTLEYEPDDYDSEGWVMTIVRKSSQEAFEVLGNQGQTSASWVIPIKAGSFEGEKGEERIAICYKPKK